MWGDIAITFLLAFITTYVFTPYSIRLARKVKALDIPKDKRKIHKKIMPRLGGIAIVAGFLLFCNLFNYCNDNRKKIRYFYK